MKNLKARPGITIIECVVYLALSALLSIMIFHWWAFSQEQLLALQIKSEQAISHRLLFMTLARDIAGANAQLQHWHQEADRITFSTQQTIIMYYLKKGTLYRVIRKAGAQRANKGVVARKLERIQWSLRMRADMVSEIEMIVHDTLKNTLEWRFPLCTGVRI